MKPQPCPNAKRAKGRLRYKGEPEYTCAPSCPICLGRALVIPCPVCEGCGLLLGVICNDCRGGGAKPAPRA